MAYNSITEGFVPAYLEQAGQIYNAVFGEQISHKESKELRTLLRERMSDQDILLSHTVFSEKQTKTTIFQVIDHLYKGKYILTGYGMLFKPGDLDTNYTGAMLNDIIIARSKVKKLYLNNIVENPLLAATYDNRQKTFKLIANSWYGVMNQSSFQFYNKAIGASTTYTGYILTTTVIMGLEGHMYNNVDFYNFSDIVTFLSNVKADAANAKLNIHDYVDEEKLLPYAEFYTMLYKRIIDKSHFELSTKQKMQLDTILGNMTLDELYRVYYKRNLIEFMDNRVVAKMFADAYHSDFLDPAEAPEAIEPSLVALDTVVEEFVSYYYMYRNRYELANNMKRKAILHADTDSVFMILQSLFQAYVKHYPVSGYEGSEDKITLNICCVLINTMNRFIDRTLELLTSRANVVPKMRGKVKMKSEFLYKRVLMTPNAKSYAGLIVAQEGKVFEKHKVDVKGLQIKKVSAAKATRKFFADILEKDILKAEDIKMAEIFKNIAQFKRNIRESFTKRGEVTFADPKTYNSLDAYDDGYTQGPVRGTILWNALCPEHEIEPFSSVNLIKLNSPTYEELQVIWADYPKELAAAKRVIFDHERMAHYGMSCICMPKSVEKIPEFLLPLIEVEEHVKTNISPFMPVLNALGCAPIYNGSTAQMTKFIRM